MVSLVLVSAVAVLLEVSCDVPYTKKGLQKGGVTTRKLDVPLFSFAHHTALHIGIVTSQGR